MSFDNQMVIEKLMRYTEENRGDYPLVSENDSLFLWNSILDEALYELGYEIDEFDATDEYPSSSKLDTLRLLSKDLGTPSSFVQIVTINGEQYVSF